VLRDGALEVGTAYRLTEPDKVLAVVRHPDIDGLAIPIVLPLV
jgi:hypothetical protein